jgi:hypothetical protein
MIECLYKKRRAQRDPAEKPSENRLDEFVGLNEIGVH